MSNTATELAAFQQFAISRLEDEGSDVTIDELFDEWRLTHPSEQELVESSRAIAASLRDLEHGKIGRPASDVIRDLRLKFSFDE